MFCELCYKRFEECTCFSGKERIKQYIHLVRKEVSVMEDVLFNKGKYYMRAGGVDKEVKIAKVIDRPPCIILSATFRFTEKDGYDYEQTPDKLKKQYETWKRTLPKEYQDSLPDKSDKLFSLRLPIKIKVIKDAEVLDKDKKRVFKQIFSPIHFAVKTKKYHGDSLDLNWKLGNCKEGKDD